MRRFAITWFALQGLGTAGWWLMLVTAPQTRSWFSPEAAPDFVLLSFWLADLLCLSAGSFVAAGFLARKSKAPPELLWFLSGAIVYATLYCVVVSCETGEAWLAAVLMTAAATGTVVCAWLGRGLPPR